jgi:hypothetical protein
LENDDLAIAAGDVDGDGYSDLVVAWDSGNAADEGVVCVFRGGSAGPSNVTADWCVFGVDGPGSEEQDLGVADVNGDGFGDVLVGAPSETSLTFTARGRVHVYFGSRSGIRNPPSITLAGPSTTPIHFGDGLSVGGGGA